MRMISRAAIAALLGMCSAAQTASQEPPGTDPPPGVTTRTGWLERLRDEKAATLQPQVLSKTEEFLNRFGNAEFISKLEGYTGGTPDRDSPEAWDGGLGACPETVLAVINAEYRWEVFTGLDCAVFADGGQMFDANRDFNFRKFELSYGMGFRANIRNIPVMRIDVGVSRESVMVWFKFDNFM